MDTVPTGAQKLIGQSVSHRAFGSGIIEELKGNVVTVNFEVGEKKFVYPEAFEHFLKLQDKESLKEFNNIMDARRKKQEARRQEIHEREITRKKIRSIKIVPNSHAVFSVDDEGLKEFKEQKAAFTGKYASGFCEGRARTAGRVKPNSLCLVTQLEKGRPESERVLRAIFMADEEYYGDEHYDGHIPAHKKYCIIFDKKQQFRLWNYVEENEVPKRFGGISFRYISEAAAKSILKAVRDSADDKNKSLAGEFYSYFLRVNKLADM